jgi:hypothetical protein
MLETRRRLSWVSAALLSGMAGLLLAGSVRPQAGRDSDLADDVRRREKVAAQKVEAELRLAFRQAERLLLTDPTKAAERFKKALEALDTDTLLPREKHDSWVRLLKNRLQVAERGPDTTVALTEKQAQTSYRKALKEHEDARREKFKRGLEQVKKLQQEGKTEEAKKLAAELAQQNPDRPAATASERITAAADRVASAKKVRAEKEKGFNDALGGVDRSAIPTDKDVSFPSAEEWRQKTKNRSSKIPLTAKEKAILSALNQPITVNFPNTKLEDAIDYLNTYLNINIILDKNSLKNSDTTYDTTVNLKVKNVSARTVLRKILADVGLTYIIKEETIQVVTPEVAKDMMVARAYYVGDILANMGALGLSPLQLTPGANQFLSSKNAQQLIEMIQDSVDPSSWRANGGNGTITYNPASMSLIIRQSAEVHAMMGNGSAVKE